MRILILGSNGQLGTDLCLTARAAGHDVTGMDLPQVDITNRASVDSAVATCRPDVILNPAAYTAVDDCETHEELATRVNRDGAAVVAAASQACGATLVHYSTDYVFAGDGARPYVESDAPGPVTAYGRSKLAGERAVSAACERHQILRIAWLYGAHGSNFVKTILKAAVRGARERTPLRVVADQRGTPTWTMDVCMQTLALIGTAHYGVFHSTSEGDCSWFDFASRIVTAAGLDVHVEPCTTDAYPRPARRPAYSVLENARLKSLGLSRMPPWDQSFDRFFAQHGAALIDKDAS
jgi:dTDP-4-dehydrorhamnose reductase